MIDIDPESHGHLQSDALMVLIDLLEIPQNDQISPHQIAAMLRLILQNPCYRHDDLATQKPMLSPRADNDKVGRRGFSFP